MDFSSKQVRPLSDDGQMFGRVAQATSEESTPLSARQCTIFHAWQQTGTNNTEACRASSQETETTLRHSVSTFLRVNDEPMMNGGKSADKNDRSSPMLQSPTSYSRYSSPPYLSSMISPTPFPSLPSTPACTATTQKASSFSSNTVTSSPVFSRELFTAMTLPSHCSLPPTSSPTTLSARDACPRSTYEFSASTGSPNSSPTSLSSSRNGSPGMSGSVDSGFSSPSSSDDNKDATKGVVHKHDLVKKNTQKKRSRRTNFSTDQVEALQRLFEKNPYPDHEAMENVGKEVEMSEKQVKIWFQNKRARHRRNNTNESTSLMQVQRMYSPMTPLGHPSPASMTMAPSYSCYPFPSNAPIFLPVIQSQNFPGMNLRPEQTRLSPNNSLPQPWSPFWPVPTSSGNFESKASSQFFPVQNAWQGSYSY